MGGSVKVGGCLCVGGRAAHPLTSQTALTLGLGETQVSTSQQPERSSLAGPCHPSVLPASRPLQGSGLSHLPVLFPVHHNFPRNSLASVRTGL